MSESANELTKFSQRHQRLLLFLALLFMVLLGYQLAEFESDMLRSQVAKLEQSVANLNQENHRITRGLNHLLAERSVCDTELGLARAANTNQLQTLASCEEQIAFYQHVMAPEISQAMLSVDLISGVWHEGEQANIDIQMVLLQPRTKKVVISGQLTVSLIVEGNEAPISLPNIDYRFTFFQRVSRTFDLPTDAKPVALLLTSDVIQYKTVREQFSVRIPWPESERL